MGLIVSLLPVLMQVISDAPKVVESAKEIWNLASQHDTPTPEQEATWNAALDAAHVALQNS